MTQSSLHYYAFFKEIKSYRKVWTIRDEEGIPTSTNHGITSMPFWSLQSRAQKFINHVPTYHGFQPYEIDLREFQDKWLTGLEKDGLYVGVNWSGTGATGYDVEPKEMMNLINKEEHMASLERKMMNHALKNTVIPYLRKQGFKGSMPHFRRMNETNIDLITFQFNKWGGAFLIELAICPLECVTTDWGEHVPPNKVTAHHVNHRFRLRSDSRGDDEVWFVFEHARTDEDFEKIANDVVLELANLSDCHWITNLHILE